MKIRAVSSRSEDARLSRLPPEAFKYFLGADPAPSQSAKNDDGSLAILRAVPVSLINQGGAAAPPYRENEEVKFADSPGDYELSWCYLRRLRNADAGQWAALMHRLHRSFVLAKMLMDMGASGGGLFVKKELAKPRQKIDGAETECTPILTLEDMGIRGHFILHAFKRKDPGIERLWGQMAGDDVLLDTAHTEMRTAIMAGYPKWPKRWPDWPEEERHGLGEENIWTLRNLGGYREQGAIVGGAMDQFANIGVAMGEDKKTYDLTRNGARQFYAVKGKKDHQMAMMLAYIAFLIWLRFDAGTTVKEEDESMMTW